MAQLFRVTNYRDSQNSWTFTFLLPGATTRRDGPPEILSREFLYAGHRWQLILLKRDTTHLSPYLQLCGLAAGMRCVVDLSFLLLNADSFTQNEKFVAKRLEFGQTSARHGARTFVSLDDLDKRAGFSNSRKELLLEVTLKSPISSFTTTLQLGEAGREPDCRRYDSERFRYGDQEWQLVFCPNMDAGVERNRHLVQLQRSARAETQSRVRYRVTLGAASGCGRRRQPFRSKALSELIDFSGSGDGFYFADDYVQLIGRDCQLQLLVELFSINTVGYAKLNFGAKLDPCAQVATTVQDGDRQNWRLNAHLAGHELGLTVVYSDLKNIPQGYLRYVCWSAMLLPVDGAKAAPEQTLDSPHESYYAAHSPADKGTSMATRVLVDELYKAQNIWVDPYDGRVTIEIDWLASYLLVNPVYSTHDDLTRRHLLQMRREVEALQGENYLLERELHSYQITISNKCASANSSQATTPHAADTTTRQFFASKSPEPARLADLKQRGVDLDGSTARHGRRPSGGSEHQQHHQRHPSSGGGSNEGGGSPRYFDPPPSPHRGQQQQQQAGESRRRASSATHERASRRSSAAAAIVSEAGSTSLMKSAAEPHGESRDSRHHRHHSQRQHHKQTVYLLDAADKSGKVVRKYSLNDQTRAKKPDPSYEVSAASLRKYSHQQAVPMVCVTQHDPQQPPVVARVVRASSMRRSARY